MTEKGKLNDTHLIRENAPEDVKEAVLEIVEGVYDRHGADVAWRTASQALRMLKLRNEDANWNAVSRDVFCKWCGIPPSRKPEDSLPGACNNLRILKNKVSGEVIMISEHSGRIDAADSAYLAKFCDEFNLRMWFTPNTAHYPSKTLGIVLCRKAADVPGDI